MTTRVRVSLGNQRQDRPQGWAVAAAAVGGLAGGLLLVLALGRSLAPEGAAPSAPGTAITPGDTEPALEPASANGPGTAVPAGNQRAGAEPAAAIESEPSAQASEPMAPAGEAGAASSTTTEELPTASQAVAPMAGTAAPEAAAAAPAPVAATASAGRVLVRGQIAYLRCEGVPLQEGPFPCPRDRRFEKQVWSALERLQQCPVPASDGDVELRVEFRSRGRHSFEVRPSSGSEALASAAHSCLAAELELVRTQLRPLAMTVAFRFELH